ncbi:MAG: adenosine monophosphate-protein transferase [Candidatus Micrarchaeota archaeon]|nr:adenosine monophosphate-protein transferase [Candidatus Micrarchaeota archaeon]
MVKVIPLEIPEGTSIILGHAHFIKTVEDLYEAIVNINPGIEFGIAFNEASQERLIRYDGNNQEMIELAIENAKRIKAGHSFVIMLRKGWPINILNAIKMVPEVARIYAATSNPVKVVILEEGEQAAVLGIMDGYVVKGIEEEKHKKERHQFLRDIGYKR